MEGVSLCHSVRIRSKCQAPLSEKATHRVVVVEFDQDGHKNTKISISPGHDSNTSGVVNAAKEKIKEATLVVLNVGQEEGMMPMEMVVT
ncbi:hypothetical protein PIB30_069725 [Stylosanthes scabra]|uniref:Uncharacterized protein n=1 Tax=Stylosanthes scabra TaxID=79078 RepID=A0ABU6YQX5_9FABA|nr:hypothetical protein [Stylosanthes scabra]